ncbi:CHAT domain-containing protein [Tautonia sociabilis]|uniref:CHAT domain-containing protein n=1 Tax=Tautonia sociabilis TaxID=2080755 RepID=A0A432MMN7_9BACT|nr:CHAT domain-containing protein [Tautonia sociabilis]RUL88560.1 CHAT domain-containing protein [Tautonia sociabilis]
MGDQLPNGARLERGDGRHRAIVRRFEAATMDEMEAMLASAELEQERALRLYLGDDRFERMRQLALSRYVSRAAEAPAGNVVILPGLMGSALHTIDRRGDDDEVWLNLWRLAQGAIGRLQLAPDGVLQADPSYSTRPGNALWKYYGELVLAMRRRWRVLVFTYDWRKDIRLAADRLLANINSTFGPDEPVHLVAHSMGGLVARSFIQRHPERWRSMWSAGADRRSRGGRLVMLGTPNHGSYLVPQVLCGLANTVWMIERLDLTRDMAGMLRVVHSFPGVYQLMPSPIVDLDAKPLYDPDTYGPIGVSARHLDAAGDFHEELTADLESASSRRAIEDRFVYFAGYGQQTADGIPPNRLDHLARVPQPAGFKIEEHYLFTFEGDGSVSRRLGQLRDGNGAPVPLRTYRVREEHSALVANPNVLSAVDEVLRLGELQRPAPRGAEPAAMAPGSISEVDWDDPEQVIPIEPRPDPDAAKRWAEAHDQDRRRFDRMLDRTRLRLAVAEVGSAAPSPPDAPDVPPPIDLTPEERELAEAIVSDFLRVPGAASGIGSPLSGSAVEPPTIAIHLALDDVSRIGDRPVETQDGQVTPPIDAIAIGHYTGEKPRPGDSAWALDQVIGRAMLPSGDASPCAFETGPAGNVEGGGEARLREAQLLLSQLIERGIARGELGQPYLVPDPREPSRVIALCGMGVPGGFGAPELTVLVRELVWTLGKLGKAHLASAPIGTRNANLPPAEATEAWIRGIKLAFSGTEAAEGQVIRHVTFVLPDPRIFPEVDRTLIALKTKLAAERRLILDYSPLTPGQLRTLHDRAIAFERAEFSRRWEERWRLWEREDPGLIGPEEGEAPDPVRITVRFGPGAATSRRVFRFGAVSRSAALPMREIDIDPGLVASANDELAAERDPGRQFARGRFLGQLLLPRDFRPLLRSGGPLVMMLDPTAARIHWELLARPELWTMSDRPGSSAEDATDGTAFLGTSRGLTRQLITAFAPPPEPPPPSRRYLRVLVVADPAADAPLPGARREGVAAVELFRAFNAAWGHSGNVVEVDALIGPSEATRTNVLRLLMGRTYDAFHYAGHCFFDPSNPAASGLLFSGGEVISAHELRRIDRVPKFAFVNACESGIVPSELMPKVVGYQPGLAPSFAEAFFERGVSNLVCTAWPVDDEAAVAFSQTLYRSLLGLSGAGSDRPDPIRPLVMHRAMRQARLAVSRRDDLPGGAHTWGAYQHYGNPDFAFFDGSRMLRGEAAVVASAAREALPASSATDKGSKAKSRSGRSSTHRRRYGGSRRSSKTGPGSGDAT